MSAESDRIKNLFLEAFGVDPSETTGLIADLAALLEASKNESASDISNIKAQIHQITRGGSASSLLPESVPIIVPTANPDEVSVSWILAPTLVAAGITATAPTGSGNVIRPGALVELINRSFLGGGSPSMTFFSRHKWQGGRVIKVNGVAANLIDFTFDDDTGTLTILDPDIHPSPSDWSIDGITDGFWSNSICVKLIVDAAPVIAMFPGFTRFPNHTLREFGLVPLDHVQIGAVYDIYPMPEIVPASTIDTTVTQHHGDLGIVRSVDTHSHSGFPGDGQPVLLTEEIEAGEPIAIYDIVSRETTGKVIKADQTDPARWGYVGVALDSFNTGNSALIQYGGKIRNEAWNWIVADKYVYVGSSGAITQTCPSADLKLLHQIGIVKDSKTIMLHPRLNRVVL